MISSVHLISSRSTLVVSVFSSEENLSRFINGELGDLAFGRVDRNISWLTILTILLNLFDVDAPSSSVDSHNLAFSTLTTVISGSRFDEDNIVLSYGNRSALMLLSEFLAELATHELSTDVGRSSEVSLS